MVSMDGGRLWWREGVGGGGWRGKEEMELGGEEFRMEGGVGKEGEVKEGIERRVVK